MSNLHSTYKLAADQLKYCPNTGSFKWAKNSMPAGGICSQGYFRVKVGGVTVKGHRLAWFITFGELPEMIDHVNGVKNDNRLSNLRKASNSENQMNRANPCANNQTGHLGVNFNKLANKYAARVQNNGKRVHVGYFDTPEDAAKAYNQAKSELTCFFNPPSGIFKGNQ